MTVTVVQAGDAFRVPATRYGADKQSEYTCATLRH